MQPLKIGFVLDTSLDAPDGVQQYILALGGWLTQNGHEVHYLVGETMRTDIPNVHVLSKNFSVSFNGNKTTIPLWGKTQSIKQLLAKQYFDVLHVQSPHHPLLAQKILLLSKPTTAVFSTFHILPYTKVARYLTKLLGYVIRPSLNRIDQMIAVSPAALDFEKWAFGLNGLVLPNVVDFKRFAAASSVPKYADKVITLLFLGRLVERKGCMQLLQSLALLDRSTLPEFRLVVCGKGQLLGELTNFVRKNNLESIVEFVGFVSESDKPSYYASADISIFPSTSGESFGIVLLEAMASGKSAVLAGDNPGYASVLAPRPDQLFDPNNPEVLANILSTYIQDSILRKRAASWGSEYTKEFDISVVGPQLVAAYQKQVAKRKLS